jgi:hypothetical protein
MNCTETVVKVKFILNAAEYCVESQNINTFASIIKNGSMIWQKLKKVIIPLIIVKLIIFVFFIFKSDIISISRDINYSTSYQQEFDNDSTVLKRQKLIRIVRNEEEPGISIKLRGREKTRHLREKEGEITIPVVD